MKKLTKRNLDELAKAMPVLSEELQQSFIGGGTGTEKDPYTEAEYDTFLSSGYFPGGYVLFGGDPNPTGLDASFTISGVEVVSYNPNDLPKSGVDSYDMMYRGAFETGFNAGKSGRNWDDFAVLLASGLAAAAAGSELGGVNYDMIYYSKGLRDGLEKGREAMGY